MAITGGIAEGKSTVLQWLREDGFSVFSSDEIARSLISDPNIRSSVASLADMPSNFNSATLRQKILESEKVRRRINHFLHPKIAGLSRQIGAQFSEVPLLIETCQWLAYDEVWVVTCGLREQRRRLLERIGDSEAMERLLAVQLATNVKTVFADVVLRTNQPFDLVRSDLDSELLALKFRADCSVA